MSKPSVLISWISGGLPVFAAPVVFTKSQLTGTVPGGSLFAGLSPFLKKP